MASRFYLKRGTKQAFEKLNKIEAEIYYLTDTNELANHKNIYTTTVDGGYFGDYENKTKFDGIDGGEF